MQARCIRSGITVIEEIQIARLALRGLLCDEALGRPAVQCIASRREALVPWNSDSLKKCGSSLTVDWPLSWSLTLTAPCHNSAI